jgi:hypothetical protein
MTPSGMDFVTFRFVAQCLNQLSYVSYSFKEHFPEDGHNRWPKHVAGYVVCITINLHVYIYIYIYIYTSIYALVGCIASNHL